MESDHSPCLFITFDNLEFAAFPSSDRDVIKLKLTHFPAGIGTCQQSRSTNYAAA